MENARLESLEKSKQLFILSLVGGGIIFIFLFLPVTLLGVNSAWAGLDTFALSFIPYLLAVVYCVGAAFYGSLRTKSVQEAIDKEAIERQKSSQSAFDVNEDVRFSAERSFSAYRRFSPYFFALLGAAVIIVSLFFFWRSWGARVEAVSPAKPMQVAFLIAVMLFFSILTGAFLIGQSRDAVFRWLRPAGAWVMVGLVVNMFAVAAALCQKYGQSGVDLKLRNIVFGILCVLAGELILSVIIEFYRPRTAEERPLFESRLLALFTEPGGVMRNIAETLDYQFGFKVSKTWMYGFIERAVMKMLMGGMAIFWLASCVVEVEPGEEGVESRFGRRLDETLQPGIHLKLPWPFGMVERFPVDKIQEMIIGPEIIDEKGEKKLPEIILWTKKHYAKDAMYLVAAELKDKAGDDTLIPASLLSASFPIQYRVKKGCLIDYAYRYDDASKLLKDIGEQEVLRYLASADYIAVMSFARGQTRDELKKLIQDKCDKMRLGVDILSMNFHDSHPPVDIVSPAFQDVIKAEEQMHTDELAAEAFREKTEQETISKQDRILSDARTHRENITRIAQAESERFMKQYLAYKEMPPMFKLRSLLDMLENDGADTRKFIMSKGIESEIYEINLEKKARLDLIDADLGGLSGGE